MQVLTYTPSSTPTSYPSSIPSTSPPTTAAYKASFELSYLYDEIGIFFAGENPDAEIIMKYLITDKAPRETFKQSILVGDDCQFEFIDEYPDDSTLISIGNDETLDETEGKYSKVTSKVDIDTVNIASKGAHATDPDNKSIYSEYEEEGVEMAKIEFCIRTDYGEVTLTDGNESSIIFNKVKVVVTFLLELGFNSAVVSVEEAAKEDTEKAALITADLHACDCPSNANSKDDCFGTAKSYNQNDILSVCVYDPNDNAIITSFKDVTLGNGQISTQVVDSIGKPTALASIGKINDDMGIVNTRIVSAFFNADNEASPAPVQVSGTAVIGFKSTSARKLTIVGMNRGKDMRKLQNGDAAASGGEGAFDVEVVLSSNEEKNGSPGFLALEYAMTLLVTLTMIPMGLF